MTSRFLYAGRGPDFLRMPPYYAGGVLYSPAGCGLGEVWEEHVRKIAGIFTPRERWWRPLACSDQTGLSTAVQALRAKGVPFRPLPACCHSTWLHIFRCAVPAGDIRLFHAFRFLRRRPRLLGRTGSARTYRALLTLGMWKEAVRQDFVRLRFARIAHDLPHALADANTVGAAIERLYDRHVAPLLRETSR